MQHSHPKLPPSRPPPTRSPPRRSKPASCASSVPPIPARLLLVLGATLLLTLTVLLFRLLLLVLFLVLLLLLLRRGLWFLDVSRAVVRRARRSRVVRRAERPLAGFPFARGRPHRLRETTVHARVVDVVEPRILREQTRVGVDESVATRAVGVEEFGIARAFTG